MKCVNNSCFDTKAAALNEAVRVYVELTKAQIKIPYPTIELIHVNLPAR